MPNVLRTPPGPVEHAAFLRPEKRQVAMAIALGVCLTTLIFLSGRHSMGASADPICESLDPMASEAVARLVHARDDVSQSRLSDAVFRLRRARKHCRYGFVGLAHNDYRALLNGDFGRSN